MRGAEAVLEHLILSLLRTTRGRVVVAALTLAVGAAFVYIAWPDVHDAWRLDRSRATIDAEVVETRTMTGQHFETIYDGRYRFQLPDRSEWFTRRERGTGRSDLWSSLDQAEWRLRAGGRVREPARVARRFEQGRRVGGFDHRRRDVRGGVWVDQRRTVRVASAQA